MSTAQPADQASTDSSDLVTTLFAPKTAAALEAKGFSRVSQLTSQRWQDLLDRNLNMQQAWNVVRTLSANGLTLKDGEPARLKIASSQDGKPRAVYIPLTEIELVANTGIVEVLHSAGSLFANGAVDEQHLKQSLWTSRIAAYRPTGPDGEEQLAAQRLAADVVAEARRIFDQTSSASSRVRPADELAARLAAVEASTLLKELVEPRLQELAGTTLKAHQLNTRYQAVVDEAMAGLDKQGFGGIARGFEKGAYSAFPQYAEALMVDAAVARKATARMSYLQEPMADASLSIG